MFNLSVINHDIWWWPLVAGVGLLIQLLLPAESWLWRAVPHPIGIFSRIVVPIAQQLSRTRLAVSQRSSRGIIWTLFFLLCSSILGISTHILTTYHPGFHSLTLFWLLAVSNPIGASRLLKTMETATLTTTFQKALKPHLANAQHIKNAEALKQAGIIASLRQFHDAGILPIILCAVAGAPGMLIGCTLQTLTASIYKSPYQAFGKLPMLLLKPFRFLGIRLATLYLIIASLFMRGTTTFRGIKAFFIGKAALAGAYRPLVSAYSQCYNVPLLTQTSGQQQVLHTARSLIIAYTLLACTLIGIALS